MKKFTTIRKWLQIAIVAELIVLLCLSGVVYAKYTADKTLTGSVTINAELGTIQILEHEAQKQPDGSYKLIGITADGKCDPNTAHTHKDGSSEKKGNTYTHVIPGLDIPKDPYVVITNKTEIPVYVFIKVTRSDDFPSTMEYTMTSSWTPVSGRNGVYVYSDDKGDPIKVTTNMTIPVLSDNMITVGQHYNTIEKVELSFTASMGQVGENGDGTPMTPNDVYSFITSGT